MSKKRQSPDTAPDSGPRATRARPGEGRRSRAASVRIDLEMLARIDAIAEARKATRAEVVRDLIATGLPISEEKAICARRKAIKLVKEPDE
jgi:predicted DNA-binding protein